MAILSRNYWNDFLNFLFKISVRIIADHTDSYSITSLCLYILVSS